MKNTYLIGILLLILLVIKKPVKKMFTLKRFTVTSTGLPNEPNETQEKNLMELNEKIIQPIEKLIGKSVYISSAFRSDEVNKKIGGAANSQHKDGLAADITAAGLTVDELFDIIKKSDIPYDQLIKEFNRWVHVSYSKKPRKETLAAVKENGKTKYLRA